MGFDHVMGRLGELVRRLRVLVAGGRAVPVRVVAPLGSLGGRFRRDQRGGTAVQMMVLLPAILFAFVAGIKLWEVIMIRHSLHTGTYLATRYLSLYPPVDTSGYVWQEVAEHFVYAEMKNNAFVRRDVSSDAELRNRLTVSVTLFDANSCTDKFEVAVRYRFWAPLGERREDLGLPGMSPIDLEEVRVGEVICD